MNEQALKDLYEEFKSTGYLGTEADFKILMSTNSDAFSDGFNQFTNTGYNGDADAFAQLIGVSNPLKKKTNQVLLLKIKMGNWLRKTFLRLHNHRLSKITLKELLVTY